MCSCGYGWVNKKPDTRARRCWINLIKMCLQWTLSSISRCYKSKDNSKRWDRSWTLFLHMWDCPSVSFKVQVMHTVSVLPLSVFVSPSVSELYMLSYRMTRWARLAPLLLLLSLFIHSVVSQEAEDPAAAAPPPPPGQASDGTQADDETEWGLNSIRGGFESVGGYFDSVLEFMGGRDGVCQYRCRYGKSDKWMNMSEHYGV